MSKRRVVLSRVLSLIMLLSLAVGTPSRVVGLGRHAGVRPAVVVAEQSRLLSPRTWFRRQPPTLDAALDEIKQMVADGKSREEIARRATAIVDVHVTSSNNLERLTILGNLVSSVLGDSAQDRRFADWRDKQGGADKQYEDIAAWVWDSRYGQCIENAALTYYLLRKAGFDDARIFARPDHAFVVWGMDEEADPNDRASWDDPQVILLDSWNSGTTRMGVAGYEDRQCGGSGGEEIQDVTWRHDGSVAPRCGFRSDRALKYPCCTGSVLPCRGTERLACRDGFCVTCGTVNTHCCDNDPCPGGLRRAGDPLVCQEGMCVSCGKEGMPCCATDACEGGLECRDGACASPSEEPEADTPTVEETAPEKPAVGPPASASGTFGEDDCLCAEIGSWANMTKCNATAWGLGSEYDSGTSNGTRIVVRISIPRRFYPDDPDGSRAYAQRCEEHSGWNANKTGTATHLVQEPGRFTWLSVVEVANALDYGWRYGLRVVHARDSVAVLSVNAKGLPDEAAVVALLDAAEACALRALDAYDAR